MKKELLLIAAAAAMFAACDRNDFLRDPYSSPESENDGAINFTSFTDNSVMTKAENSSALYTQSFLAHHSTFDVWGFKTGTNASQVFGTALSENKSTVGTTVTVAGTLASPTYSYSPKRFWDKSASAYYFYAVAPSKINSANWATFNAGATSADGYFTATNVALTGVNLRDLATATTYATGAPGALQNNFNGTNEIDRLIAAPCEVLPNRYSVSNPDKVHLNFIHILSKLNVSIKKNATTLPDDPYTVTLTEFGVYNMPGTGDFNESTAANQSGSNNRWSLNAYKTENSNTVYNHSKKINYLSLDANATKTLVVTDDDQYIVESLVIPQDISYERVALDGKAHAETSEVVVAYYANYAEYTAAKPYETPELSEARFNTIKAAVDAGTATPAQIDSITKTKAKPAVAAYLKVENEAYVESTSHSSEPYFKITYTINNGENTETFTYYYNLVAAFKNYDNDSHKSNGDAISETTLAFNEGWQNTLHITINPDAIEFTADVAEWADALDPEPEFEIE